MEPLLLEYMSWPEVKERLAGVKLALVPTGSCEQHGPNETFATDTDRAREVARLVAARLGPRALVCPVVPYGVSPYHMGFPGTITLRVETYLGLLTDIALSLKHHGITSVLFVNGHGGNRYSLGALCAKLYHEHGMQCGFTGIGSDVTADFWDAVAASKVRGHACEAEVSQALYLAPQVVKREALTPGELIEPRYGRRVPWAEYFWPFHRITRNGALGDATRASVELGKEMTELVVERVVAFVREFYFGETS